MSYVSEAGLYELVFASKKPEARQFKRWVFEEILPQIRKTGKYEIAQQLPQNYIEALECLVRAVKDKIELQTQNIQLESTVKEKDIIIEVKDTQIESAKNLFKQVADKTGCIKFKACASLLNITESELKGVLRSNKWIYLNKLFPTTEARMNGYVKNLPEEFKIQTKDGKTLNKQRLSFFITERGYYNLLEKVAGITMN